MKPFNRIQDKGITSGMKLKASQKQSINMELENQKLESQLMQLKEIISNEQSVRNVEQQGTRWKSANIQQPLKNYAKVVLEAKQHKQINSRPSSSQININNDDHINNSFLLNKLSSNNQKQNSVEQNLNKALKLQTIEQDSDMGAFFSKIKRKNLLPLFVNNGFDDIDVIKEITMEHLDMMNMTNDDKVVILREVHNINNPKSVSKVDSSCQKEQINNTEDKLADGMLNEEENRKQFQEALNEFRQKDEKNTEFIPQVEEKLGYGVYDEEENQKQFQQALIEFRNKNQTEKKVRFEDDIFNKYEEFEQISSKPKKQMNKIKSNNEQSMSLFNLGGSTWNNEQFENLNEVIESSTQIEEISNKIIVKYCFQCLKKITQLVFFKSNEFCSNYCVSSYENQNQIVCHNQMCQTTILNSQAHFFEANWYCSEICFKPNDQSNHISILYQQSQDENNVQINLHSEINQIDDVDEIDILIPKKKFISLEYLEQLYKEKKTYL